MAPCLTVRFRLRWRRAATALRSAMEYLLLGTLLASSSPGQQLTQYSHKAWRVQEGIFDAAPVSIAQTTDGFLWIGTENGLVRFDGADFESWNDRLHQLRACCAFSVLGSKDGALWIGTGTGLAKLEHGKLSAVTTGDGRYNTLLEDAEGRIWGARTRIRDNKGPLCEIKGSRVQCHGEQDGLVCRNGNALSRDNNGTIWVGDQGQVCSWRAGVGATYPAPSSDAGCKPGIQSLLADYEQSLLIGCDGGLRRLEQGRFMPFRPALLQADNLRGATLLRDRGGDLWIGTQNDGLYRISHGVADHFGIADGLSDNNVSALFEDREGNIWAATPEGLDQFHRLNVISFSSKQGFSGIGSAILASRDGHTIWISGVQGLAVLRDGKVSLITRKQGLPGQQVTALFEDHSGVLWLGIDQDLFSYTKGQFHRRLRSDGKPTDMVVGIAEAADGTLWIVTAGSNRLLRMDAKTGAVEVSGKMQTPSRITNGPNGEVYLLSFLEGQVAILRNARAWEKIPLPTGPRTARALLAFEEGSLFVATDAGLYRWKEGNWSVLNAENGLPCEAVQDLTNDQEGGLWLHLTCGYAHISNDDLSSWSRDKNAHLNLKFYDALDGARAGRGNFEPGHARTLNGQLWFATVSVLQMIDPHRLTRNELSPPVHILRIVADEKTVSPTGTVTLPPRTRRLEIDYAGLSLVSPQKVRFRYALWGADDKWQEAGNRREAYYMNLRPGHYRFQVIACNNDGIWNEQGASLDFGIAPAYYQRNWFRILCVLMLFGLFWAVYEWRVRQLHHAFEVTLDARVAERTRIARDLHDTLLQSFQGLLLHFQAAINMLAARPVDGRKLLEDAVDRASQAIAEGRDAVQGLRRSTIESNDLAVSIRTVGEELASAPVHELSSNFNVVVEGTPRHLRSILRDEIYRLATEALRNAFRHASAKNVEVEIRYDKRYFRLRVRDDGKGIPSDVLRDSGREGHYGLPGMRERAKVVGGKLTIWTELDGGTEIELTIPAARAYVKSTRSFWTFANGSSMEDTEKRIERE